MTCMIGTTGQRGKGKGTKSLTSVRRFILFVKFMSSVFDACPGPKADPRWIAASIAPAVPTRAMDVAIH